MLSELVERGILIETEIADFDLEGYEMVVKHRRLPFVSFPIEWSPLMMRDAALLVGELEMRLRAKGFAINVNDLDPWNVLFDGSRPVYIDFGSIRDANELAHRRYDDFLHSCAFPARLAGNGQGRLARALLRQENGPLLNDLASSGGQTSCATAKGSGLMRRLFSVISSPPQGDASDIKHAMAEIERLQFPTAKPSAPPPTAVDEALLTQLIDRLAPRSAFLAGNIPDDFALRLGGTGCDVVFADRDEHRIDRLYRAAGEKKASLLPLVLDLRRPTPGLGVCNQEQASASERLVCDMVLAVGAVEWLVFQRYLNLDQTAATLAQWAKRFLVVEFVPIEDETLRRWAQDSFYAWYNLDNFRQSLARHFASVEIADPSRSERSLLVCTR
jgi:hypothetical protein